MDKIHIILKNGIKAALESIPGGSIANTVIDTLSECKEEEQKQQERSENQEAHQRLEARDEELYSIIKHLEYDDGPANILYFEFNRVLSDDEQKAFSDLFKNEFEIPMDMAELTEYPDCVNGISIYLNEAITEDEIRKAKRAMNNLLEKISPDLHVDSLDTEMND